MVHSGEKEFACKTCGQAFTQSVHLKTHMVIHSGKKDFSCEACGKSFSLRSNLKRHMVIHSSIQIKVLVSRAKPSARLSGIKCSLTWKLSTMCETRSQSVSSAKTQIQIRRLLKWITQRTRRRRNHVIHSVERNFSSETCRKPFFQRDNLSTNIVFRPGGKYFICKICGKSFTPLKAFRKTCACELESQINCEKCGKSITQWIRLKIHRVIHSGENNCRAEGCR